MAMTQQDHDEREAHLAGTLETLTAEERDAADDWAYECAAELASERYLEERGWGRRLAGPAAVRIVRSSGKRADHDEQTRADALQAFHDNRPVSYRCEACGATTEAPAQHEHHHHDDAQTCWTDEEAGR